MGVTMAHCTWWYNISTRRESKDISNNLHVNFLWVDYLILQGFPVLSAGLINWNRLTCPSLAHLAAMFHRNQEHKSFFFYKIWTFVFVANFFQSRHFLKSFFSFSTSWICNRKWFIYLLLFPEAIQWTELKLS